MLPPPGEQHKHFFLIIRYSIVSEDLKGGWKLAAGHNIDEVRDIVYHPDRLNDREFIFKHITLPSLTNQTIELSADWLSVIIMIGEHLPEPWKGNLHAMVKNYPWIRIVEVKEKNETVVSVFKNIISTYHSPLLYASSRLDDDDALDKDFFKDTLRYFKPEYTGMVLSYGNGYAAIIKHRKILSVHDYYFPKLAIGMTYFNEFHDGRHKGKYFSVYDLGKHTEIDKKVPTLLVSGKKGFIRSYHASTDSAQHHTRAAQKLPLAEDESCLDRFNITIPFIQKEDRKYHRDYHPPLFKIVHTDSNDNTDMTVSADVISSMQHDPDMRPHLDGWHVLDPLLLQLKEDDADIKSFEAVHLFIHEWKDKRLKHADSAIALFARKTSNKIRHIINKKKSYNIWVSAEARALRMAYIQWVIKYKNIDIDFYHSNIDLITRHKNKLKASTRTIDSFNKIHNLNALKALLWAFSDIENGTELTIDATHKMREILTHHLTTDAKSSARYIRNTHTAKKTLYSPWWNEQDYTDFMPE